MRQFNLVLRRASDFQWTRKGSETWFDGVCLFLLGRKEILFLSDFSFDHLVTISNQECIRKFD